MRTSWSTLEPPSSETFTVAAVRALGVIIHAELHLLNHHFSHFKDGVVETLSCGHRCNDRCTLCQLANPFAGACRKGPGALVCRWGTVT